jgi:hypothetical protein
MIFGHFLVPEVIFWSRRSFLGFLGFGTDFGQNDLLEGQKRVKKGSKTVRSGPGGGGPGPGPEGSRTRSRSKRRG